MNHEVLITFEILLVVVTPLIVLYRNSTWPLRTTVLCPVSIPPLWYLTYSPLHELSHVAGTYLVGGTVTYIKLIPRFWLGEFARAWITTDGIRDPWQQLISTGSPYILDVVCIASSVFIVRQTVISKSFIVGCTFMLLCLRPAFDFVCEPVAFLLGDRGDFYSVGQIIGGFDTWLFIILSLGLSLVSIVSILKRYTGFPAASSSLPIHAVASR